MTGSSARPNSSARYDPAISDTSTSGGSSDTGQNALTVAPTSSRPSATVTSVTPAVHELQAPASAAAGVASRTASHGPFGQLMIQVPGSISGPYGGRPARAARRQAGPQPSAKPKSSAAAAAGRASLDSGGRSWSSGVSRG